MKIVLSGKPISTQHAYGQSGNRRFLKKNAKERKEQYQWEAKSQWRGNPLAGDVNIHILVFFSDNRRRDWDNWHKISMDSLEGIVVEDDSQIQEATVTKAIDKSNPRMEIYIEADDLHECEWCGKRCSSAAGLKNHQQNSGCL